MLIINRFQFFYYFTLQIEIDISSWLRPFSNKSIPMENFEDGDDPDLLTEVFCYTVL